MKFRLTGLLYVFALLAAAMGTFGGAGVIVAGMVLLFWVAVWQLPRTTVIEWCVIVLIIGVLIALLLPTVEASRGLVRSSYCRNNMKQIALALTFYDETHGVLPEATSFDQGGQPLHSWRARILPQLDYQLLHDRLKFDEPWDSGTNVPLTSTPVEAYTCWGPSSEAAAGETPYFVITGPGTLWPPEVPRSLSDIPDGPPTTLLVIESAPTSPWAKPGDLSFNKALKLLTSPIVPDENGGHYMPSGFFYKTGYGRNVFMSDGSWYRLRGPLPEALARAILTADGGEEIDLAEIEAWSGPELDRAKVACFTIFLLVAILPLVLFVKRRVSGEA